jgi:hypothetical protein
LPDEARQLLVGIGKQLPDGGGLATRPPAIEMGDDAGQIAEQVKATTLMTMKANDIHERQTAGDDGAKGVLANPLPRRQIMLAGHRRRHWLRASAVLAKLQIGNQLGKPFDKLQNLGLQDRRWPVPGRPAPQRTPPAPTPRPASAASRFQARSGRIEQIGDDEAGDENGEHDATLKSTPKPPISGSSQPNGYVAG